MSRVALPWNLSPRHLATKYLSPFASFLQFHSQICLQRNITSFNFLILRQFLASKISWLDSPTLLLLRISQAQSVCYTPSLRRIPYDLSLNVPSGLSKGSTEIQTQSQPCVRLAKVVTGNHNGCMKEFDSRHSPFNHIHPALGPTDDPTQWVSAKPLWLEVKRPKTKANHSARDYRGHDWKHISSWHNVQKVGQVYLTLPYLCASTFSYLRE